MQTSKPFEALLTYLEINNIPVISFIGYSKSGKTASIERLIEHSNDLGLKILVMKKTNHPHPIFDTPGKNTWKYSQKGAHVVLAKSQVEVVSFLNTNLEDSDLAQYLILQLDFQASLNPSQKMILMCEGFRNIQVNQILCATNMEDLEDQLSKFPSIVAIAGKITNNGELQKEFEKTSSIPFVNCLEKPKILFDLLKI
ncbi:MAG: molybdopterin-guanine dinucleotide biosynthesis protein MobB [Promethearchaeota archaeon]